MIGFNLSVETKSTNGEHRDGRFTGQLNPTGQIVRVSSRTNQQASLVRLAELGIKWNVFKTVTVCCHCIREKRTALF